MGTARATRTAAAAAGGGRVVDCKIGSRGRCGRKQRCRMSLPWRQRRGWMSRGLGLGFCGDGDWGIGVIRVRAPVPLSVFKTGFGSGRTSEDEEKKRSTRERWGAALAVLRLPVPQLRCAAPCRCPVFHWGSSGPFSSACHFFVLLAGIYNLYK
jgi:hypothetical protein